MPKVKSKKKRNASSVVNRIAKDRRIAQKAKQWRVCKQRRIAQNPLTKILMDPNTEICLHNVDEYFRNVGKFGKVGGLSTNESVFALEYLSNGYRSEPAAVAVQEHVDFAKDPRTPLFEGETAREFARRCLGKISVRRFIQKQIDEKLDRLQVTDNYLYSKYLAWAELDVSEILELKHIKIKGTKAKRYMVCLREDLDKLPAKVRSAISSMSITPQGDLKVEFVSQKAALDQLVKLHGAKTDEDSGMKAEVHMHFDAQDLEA